MQIFKIVLFNLLSIGCIIVFIRFYQWVCEKTGIFALLNKLWKAIYNLCKKNREAK